MVHVYIRVCLCVSGHAVQCALCMFMRFMCDPLKIHFYCRPYLNNIKTQNYSKILITAHTNAMPYAMDARMVCACSQIYVNVMMVIGG